MKASEIMHDKEFPHGTLEGRRQGCKGSHCPGRDVVGMTCEAIGIRYAGDLSFKRRLDGGMSIRAILDEDSLTVVAPRKTPNVGVTPNGQAYINGTVTVADSATPVDHEPLTREELDAMNIDEPSATEADQFEKEPAAPKRLGRPPAPTKHGTRYAYEHRGCRTEEECPGDLETGLTCVQAHREYANARARRGAPATEAAAVEAQPVMVEQIAEPVDVPVALVTLDDEWVANTTAHEELSEKQGGRVEGLLSDLADAKETIERLNDELAAAEKRALADRNEVGAYLERQGVELLNARDEVAALKESLVQSGISLDVALTNRPAARGVSCSVTITPVAGGGVRVTSQGMDAETAAELAGRVFASRVVEAA